MAEPNREELLRTALDVKRGQVPLDAVPEKQREAVRSLLRKTPDRVFRSLALAERAANPPFRHPAPAHVGRVRS